MDCLDELIAKITYGLSDHAAELMSAMEHGEYEKIPNADYYKKNLREFYMTLAPFLEVGIDEDSIGEDHYNAGRCYFFIAVHLNGEEQVTALQRAITHLNHAVRLDECADYHFFLGRAYTELARETFDLEEKTMHYENGISHLEGAVCIGDHPADYYFLADAQVALAEDTLDFDQKRELVKKARSNWNVSFRMDGDPRTWMRIRQLDRDFAYLQ